MKFSPLLLAIPFSTLLLCSSGARAQDVSNQVADNLGATANAAANGVGSLPPYAVPVVPVAPAPALPLPNVPSGVGDILKGRFPLSIGFEDLGAGWRVFEYGDLYFTRGETQFLGKSEYVVAYKRVYSNPADLSPREYALYVSRSLYRTGSGDRFRISLLPAQSVQGQFTGGQTGLRSFAPDDFKPIASLPTSEAFEQNLSLVFLRKIGEAVSAYSRANLNVLPPLDSAAQARQNLEEFAENPAIFTQPGTTRPFAFNPLFSGRKRAHLKGKNYLILAYEAAPGADGSHAVLTLGGTVSRLGSKQWRRLAKASQLD